MTSGRARLAVRIDPTVWDEEVGRFAVGSQARAVAQRARQMLERDGLGVTSLLRCAAAGVDGTTLGFVKVYLPLGDGPPSARPYGLVLSPEHASGGLRLELVAFGERHPERSATRSVYERAHKRVHGKYPDQ
jgi:hypothetical protein